LNSKINFHLIPSWGPAQPARSAKPSHPSPAGHHSTQPARLACVPLAPLGNTFFSLVCAFDLGASSLVDSQALPINFVSLRHMCH
jgi:hypothetical protein